MTRSVFMPNETLKLALIGADVLRSPSEQLHQMLFPVLTANHVCRYNSLQYDLLQCNATDDLKPVLTGLQNDGFTGVNITAPFKTVAGSLAERRTEEVDKTSSTNCIGLSEPTCAFSTDGKGLRASLAREVAFDPSRFELVILGAGGAARSVLFSLVNLGWKEISIVRRSAAQDGCIRSFAPAAVFTETPVRRADSFLVVQATSVGYHSIDEPYPELAWREGDIAYDVVYSPSKTEFLRRAESGGARTVGGLGMLIEQAAFAQSTWLSGFEPARSPLHDNEYYSIRDRLETMIH